MEHGAPLVAGILGALKAGKIYLALDPNQAKGSAGRRARGFAGATFTGRQAERGAGGIRSRPKKIKVLEVEEKFPASSPRATWPAVSPAAGAWLMFTSGSTGTPKGVWQNHSGVIHHTDVTAG